MNKLLPLLLIVVAVVVAACDSDAPLQNAVASTPIDALPVSNNAPRPEIRIPTAVPAEILQAEIGRAHV